MLERLDLCVVGARFQAAGPAGKCAVCADERADTGARSAASDRRGASDLYRALPPRRVADSVAIPLGCLRLAHAVCTSLRYGWAAFRGLYPIPPAG